MDQKSADELQEHMLGTYHGLRIGLVVIGFALPIVLFLAGIALHGAGLEPSISRYYYTVDRVRFLTTRDLFVGGLLAAASCLYLYKGYSTRENVALNLAGVFALGVALLPTAEHKGNGGLIPTLHNTSAVLFFLCIAYVSVFRSRDTLRLLPAERRARYAQLYLWTGLAMVLSPLAALGVSYLLEPTSRPRTLVFWIESFGVWAFAAYWYFKTREMGESSAEEGALDAKLERRVVPTTSPDQPGATSGASGAILRTLTPESGNVERIVPAPPAPPPQPPAPPPPPASR